jgi:CRP/FNR family cyclic AMP-dependent transcriptional regulator
VPPTVRSTTVRVLDEDRDLAAALAPESLAEARLAAVAPLVEVPRGEWNAPDTALHPTRDFGLLVLRGLLTRDQQVAGRTFTELRGEEDLLRPWDDADDAILKGTITWTALQPTRIAWLDGDFASATTRWPELCAALLTRAVRRARLLSFRTAILELKHIDLRVLLLVWHLADRWGRVGRAGVYLDLPLTHALIARMVGAHRSSVTLAIRELCDAGRLERTDTGGWLLLGTPPEELSDRRD